MSEKAKRLFSIIKTDDCGINNELIGILNKDLEKIFSEYFTLKDAVSITVNTDGENIKIAVSATATAVNNITILD